MKVPATALPKWSAFRDNKSQIRKNTINPKMNSEKQTTYKKNRFGGANVFFSYKHAAIKQRCSLSDSSWKKLFDSSIEPSRKTRGFSTALSRNRTFPRVTPALDARDSRDVLREQPGSNIHQERMRASDHRIFPRPLNKMNQMVNDSQLSNLEK